MTVQFAVNVLSPVLPLTIEEIGDQPLNVYPILSGEERLTASSIVYDDGLPAALVPPFRMYDILYEMTIQFAVNVLSPVLPLSIEELGDQPLNVYPALVGAERLTVSSIVYDDGLPAAFVPPFRSYVIVYVTGVQFAVNVLFPVLPLAIEEVGDQPLNVYPVLSGAERRTVSSTVYDDGLLAALVPPFRMYDILYEMTVQFAVNVLSPVLPLVIEEVGDQPLNV